MLKMSLFFSIASEKIPQRSPDLLWFHHTETGKQLTSTGHHAILIHHCQDPDPDKFYGFGV